MIDRRTAMWIGTAAVAAWPTIGAASPEAGIVTVTGGLRIPESPLIIGTDSVLVCEVRGRCITRVNSDGTKKEIVALAGRPAGIAAGPDGALYIADIGAAASATAAAVPGSVLRVDPDTRAVTPLLIAVEDKPPVAPDDLVFDSEGGFYFTDAGNLDPKASAVSLTGIYYHDGKSARRVAAVSLPTNGIDLSADGKRLYWTEYRTGRVYMREVIAPGVLKEPARPNEDCIYSHPAPVRFFDSLRVDAEGCVTIAIHEESPKGRSSLLTLNSEGRPIENVEMSEGMTTSLACDWRTPTVYITSGEHLLKMAWPRLGQKPRYLPSPRFLE